MEDAERIIAEYGLSPHPEGGWFREFHCSGRMLERLPGYPGPRAALTAIWFCLGRGDFSAFHRLRSEEAWIHLAGGPIELVLLRQGAAHRLRIARVEDGGPPGAVVPAETFQAARPLGDYGFSACLVAPGFDFRDFELPSRERLLEEFPGETDVIRSLTR
ncbi:MAG: cupin domain-containing protein [Thermodesulfobacteriota bacterium]